ncbi:hypothetical protein WJX74_008447 [Apatococcus lobatus]|uniref:Uncharacterized protein n=2 Tax=Apatococcus TaxID=904362 RepID=A0AAW1TET4_9CHLO
MNFAIKPSATQPSPTHGSCRPLLRRVPRAVADPAWFTETHAAGPSCPWPRWESGSFSHRQAQPGLASSSWSQKSRTLAVQTARLQEEQALSRTARLEACLSSDAEADMEAQPAWLTWWRYQGLKF